MFETICKMCQFFKLFSQITRTYQSLFYINARSELLKPQISIKDIHGSLTCPSCLQEIG